MSTFASLVFIALFVSTFALGLLCGRSWGRWEIHNDPAHIDRLARKDRQIEHWRKLFEDECEGHRNTGRALSHWRGEARRLAAEKVSGKGEW